MRRNAVCLFTSVAIAVTVGGCKSPGRKVAATGPPGTPLDPYVAPDRDTGAEADPYPTYRAAVPLESAYEPSPATPALEERYHTVIKNDTLYGLARLYYNDQRRWKDIYEANRAVVSDPDKIRIGQRLLIP